MRQSILVMLVVLLLGVLFVRESRLQQTEEIFLRWLLSYSPVPQRAVPLTIVELRGSTVTTEQGASNKSARAFLSSSSSANSPLELALFLQALSDFKPTIVAFERVLKWPASSHDEEQVLVDQAMRVPKLLLAADLTATADPDAPEQEISGFPQVIGNRGELPTFSGIAAQPDEDLRLISTPGFVQRLPEVQNRIHAPLLYLFRGDVIPSFALQAAMLWMKVTPGEVKIDLGSSITFPNGYRIPILRDGTTLINPSAVRNARRISVDALLLAAQQHEKHLPSNPPLDDLANHIVLARLAKNPLDTNDLIAASIASIEAKSFIHRVSRIFDCVVLVLIAAASGPLRKLARIELVLVALAFTAGYCLIALKLLSENNLWLPGFLPLGAIWTVVVLVFVFPQSRTRSAS